MTTSATDRDDVEDFYRSHRVRAVRWATALVGCPEVGADVAQEAMLAVARKLSSVDDPAKYLRRTVINRARSWHRWHQRERRRLQRVTDRAPTSSVPSTNEMLAVVAQLPFKQRTVLVLRYWGDWSDEDIAHTLGCAQATVRGLAATGLSTLRRQLEDA